MKQNYRNRHVSGGQNDKAEDREEIPSSRKRSPVSDPGHARSTKSLSFFTKARVASVFQSLKPIHATRCINVALLLMH